MATLATAASTVGNTAAPAFTKIGMTAIVPMTPM